MKLTLMEDEIIDMLQEDYECDDMDAHDAVIAAKVLGLIRVEAPVSDNAEIIFGEPRCWNN